MHSPLPTVRDPRLSAAIRRITVEERARFMLKQIAAGPGAPLPVKAMPQDTRERLLLPVLMPVQHTFLSQVLNPKGPSVIGMMGGIGVGKTAAEGWGLGLIGVVRPGSESMIVGHTRKNLQKNVLPFINSVLTQPKGMKPYYKYDPVAGCYTLENGSIIWVSHYRLAKGADESTNPIEGANISGLFCVEEAEAINPMVMQHALDRLRGQTVDLFGRSCGPTLAMCGRPAQSRWWMRAAADLSSKMGTGDGMRGGSIIIAKTKDNYHLEPDYLPRLRKSRTLEDFLAITECAPAPASGAYYSHFKTMDDKAERIMWPESNLVPAAKYAGPGLVRVGVDPGLNSPAAVIYRIVPTRDPRTGKMLDLFVILATVTPSRMGLKEKAMQEANGGVKVVRRGELAMLIEGIHDACDECGWVIEAGRGDPANASTENYHSGYTDFDILERDRDDWSDASGPGLGVYFDRIEDPAKRIVRNGIKRIQALICNAMKVPERRLVCTDRYWDWAESQEQNSSHGADQPKTWAYTVRAYTKEVVATKRTMRRDHDSTHVADALRYAIAVDYWSIDGVVPDGDPINERDDGHEREAEHWLSSR